MKLAIIGSGPLAIFCAQHFHHLGAEVVLFQKNALGGNVHFSMKHFSSMEIVYKQDKKNITDFWRNDLKAAISYLEENNVTKAGDVLRVQKRFLHPGEQIEGRSRLHDLFRVVYSVNPKQSILKQVEENPEIFKQLGEQVLESLHLPVESYEDFDLVIEARGLGRRPLPMGPSCAPAINELNLKSSVEVLYGRDCLDQLRFNEKKHITLIGNHDLMAAALIKCEEWLFSSPLHSISWIASKEVQKNIKNQWLAQEVLRIFMRGQVLLEKEKDAFEKELHNWRALEDYIRVKVPRPVEPMIKIKLYEGHDITSVDKLLDQSSIFITLESPDFRANALRKNDVKTLSTDLVLVGQGFYDNEIQLGLEIDEPGHYILESDELDPGLERIKEIEASILAFFTRK